MDFADYLRSFKTQTEAAAFLGVTQGAISHWLKGIRTPGRVVATRIVERSGGKVSFDQIWKARK